MDLPLSSALLALPLALVPGLVAWWTGRALRGHADDPALPELLLGRRQRLTKVTTFALVLLVVLAGKHAVWAVPLEILGLLVGRYPLRRSLFAESWTLPQYLRYSIFDPIGSLGLWLAVGFAPAIVVAIVTVWTPPAPRRLLAAALMGIVAGAALLLWQRHYVRVWLRLHRATPLVDDGTPARQELLARFDAVLQHAGASLHRRPLVYRYGAPGAHVLNAVALPSLHEPSVAISDGLLQALSADELAAVFAHEIAHHEHHNARRLRVQRWKSSALIAGTAVLPAALLALDPQVATVAGWFWPLIVVLVLGRRVASHRAHETESDLRATALTGDAEAMARALVKLHVGARLPRRWPHELERAATHPSLARRVQAIRARGAAAIAALGEPTIVPSTKVGSYVVLDAARAYWFDGVPDEPAGVRDLATLRERASSYRAAGYADLTELRVIALGTTRVLRASDRSGSSWSVPLRADDVARVQQALDLVDVQLAGASPELAAASPQFARLLALVVLIAMMMAGGPSVLVIPAFITVFWPGGGPLLATGVMGVARALLVLLSPDSVSWPFNPLRGFGLALLAIAGAWSMWAGWRWSRDEAASDPPPGRRFTRQPRLVLVALAVAALFGAIPLISAAFSLPPATILGDPMLGALGALLLGAGAVLVRQTRRASRVCGGLAVALAAAVLVAAAADAPVFTTAPRLTSARGTLQPVARVPVGGNGYELQLSPSGTRFMTRVLMSDDEDRPEARFLIGRFDSSAASRSLDAIAAAFVDDDRLLVLDQPGAARDSLELRLERANMAPTGGGASAAVVWRRTLPRLAGPRLLVDRATGRWNVVGWSLEGTRRATVVAAGTVRGDSMMLSHDSNSGYGDQVLFAFRDGALLGSSMDLPSARTGGVMSYALLAALGWQQFQWTLWMRDSLGHRRLQSTSGFLTCGEDESIDAALCTSQERRALELLRIGRNGVVTELARLRGSYANGHVDGALLVAREPLASTVSILDLHTRHALRLSLPDEDGGIPQEVAAAPGLVATLARLPGARGGRMTVSLYRVRER